MHSEDYFGLYKRENGIWYYYVYRWGKKVRRSTCETKKADAIRVVLLRRDRGDLLNELAHTRFTTFAEYCAPFWIWETCPIIRDKIERGGHFSKLLAKTNRQNTDKYLVPAFGHKVLPEISPAMIKVWLRGLPPRFTITPQTANKQLTMLRQILDVAVEERIIPDNPARLVKPLIPKASSRGCFTPEQVKALFSGPWGSPKVELMCRLSSLTGMRLGEVRGLCREQVKKDHIVLDRSWAKDEKFKAPKSGRPRIVPIPCFLAEALLSIDSLGELIFSKDGERPLDQTSVRYWLRMRMEECGIDWKKESLTFHSFRHFFNTRLLAAGIQGETIRAVIGHEDEKMTQLYGHLSEDDCGRIRVIQEAIV